ncbi:MAG TPA: SIMPL domain-containing protein [Anaerolineales bacterium]|nr:SIMPL domain-containing protein [Anaerolineales bacterium]
MDTKPDTIKVSASHREEIFASHANLYVTVKGSSVVGGNEAMKKAREVSQLVEALTRFGLSQDAVQLLGVHIETSSGALLKSSSATYRLRVHLQSLDSLTEILDIIASQKNATLERIEWKYPEEAAQEHALEAAIAKGKAKAEKVAAAMGVKLLGVYEFMENTFDEERPPMPFQAMEMSMKSRAMAMADQPSLNMEIQHSKTVNVNIDIWYRVSSFEELD